VNDERADRHHSPSDFRANSKAPTTTPWKNDSPTKTPMCGCHFSFPNTLGSITAFLGRQDNEGVVYQYFRLSIRYQYTIFGLKQDDIKFITIFGIKSGDEKWKTVGSADIGYSTFW